MKLILLLAIAAAGLSQQTPQLSIIPSQGGPTGVINLYERKANGTSYVTLQAGDAIATSCAFSLTDVSILPCANNQVDIGSAALRFKKMWAQDADIDAGLTVGGNAGFSGNILFSGTMNPLFSGLGTIGTAGLPYGTVNGLHLVAQTDFRLGNSTTAGYCLTADALGFGTWQSCGAGGALPVVDTSAIVFGSADATKLLRFEVDGFTAATTRILTPQNADYIMAGINIAQTFSQIQTFGANLVPSSAGSWSVGTQTVPFSSMGATNFYAVYMPGGLCNYAGIGVVVPSVIQGGIVYVQNSACATQAQMNVAGFDTVGTLGQYHVQGLGVITANRHLANIAGVSTSLIPTADATYALGSTSFKFGSLYAYNANSNIVSPFSVPSSSVGTVSFPYSQGHFQNLTVTGTCTGCGSIPDATQFVRGAVNTSSQNFGGQKTFYGSILPGAGSTYSNGTLSFPWLNVTARKLEIGSSAGGWFTLDHVSTNLLQLKNSSGTTVMQWSSIFGNVVDIAADTKPTLNGTYDLGGTFLRWRNFYTNNLDMLSSGNATIYVGSGNFYNRTFAGSPSCAGVTDGWTGVDTFNLRIWVCIAGVARYATLF